MTMGRSRREVCIDILKALAYSGPLKLTRIMREVHVNYNDMHDHLGLLTKRNLVEAKTVSKKRVFYVITKSGRSVVETFREIEQMLPVTGQAGRFGVEDHTITSVKLGFAL